MTSLDDDVTGNTNSFWMEVEEEGVVDEAPPPEVVEVDEADGGGSGPAESGVPGGTGSTSTSPCKSETPATNSFKKSNLASDCIHSLM